MTDADGTTFGVEEEFLLVDPGSLVVVPRASELMSAVAPHMRGYVQHELLETQVETSTPVCRDLGQLRHALRQTRRIVQDAARRVGCRTLAAGTGIMSCPDPPPLVAGERYARIAEVVGGLVAVPGVSACHVHVGVADPETAIQVLNHIRPYLPALQALGANSPFADGRDTGYASWRWVLVDRWPTSGPSPLLTSVAHAETVVRELRSQEVILDAGMLYWYARRSVRYPTVEIRVSDVCLTIEDTVVLAALSRALVKAAVRSIRDREPPPELDDRRLAVAHWRAAKDGLEGYGIDCRQGDLVPAWMLVDRLLEYVGPSLVAAGDFDTVTHGLARLRRQGSGAARQRQAFACSGDLRNMARQLLLEQEREPA